VDASTYRAMVTDDESVGGGGIPIIRMDNDGWLDAVATFVETHIMNRR